MSTDGQLLSTRLPIDGKSIHRTHEKPTVCTFKFFSNRPIFDQRNTRDRRNIDGRKVDRREVDRRTSIINPIEGKLRDRTNRESTLCTFKIFQIDGHSTDGYSRPTERRKTEENVGKRTCVIHPTDGKSICRTNGNSTVCIIHSILKSTETIGPNAHSRPPEKRYRDVFNRRIILPKGRRLVDRRKVE